MGVVYRKSRGTWGFRKFYRGKVYRESRWTTKEEAEQAFARFLVELKTRKQVAQNAFVTLVNEYLIDCKRRGLSDCRVKALRWTFNAFVVPFFKPHTLAGDIGPKDIEAFVELHRKRVSLNTVWRYTIDVRALFNWAIKKGLLATNPVPAANLAVLKGRFKAKLPLDPAKVEKAAECLDGVERAYFDFLRYTGARLQEGNRLQWSDLDLENGFVVIPGSKTGKSNAILPLAPALIHTLENSKKNSQNTPAVGLVFPSVFGKHKGKRVYSRKAMFARIHELTGIKLRPKDLRDYFLGEVVPRTDPITAMHLMRHTTLAMTPTYGRVVLERMKEAVKGLGSVTNFGDHFDTATGQKRAKLGNVDLRAGARSPRFQRPNKEIPAEDKSCTGNVA
jgi:integrase